MTYYELLKLTPNATTSDIKKSFRRLSLLYHPDRNPGTEEMFKKINEAYEILSDDEKRKRYDNENRIKKDENRKEENENISLGCEDNNVNDMMKMFFKQYSSQNIQHMNSQSNIPETLTYNLDITLEEAYNGISKPIQIERWIFENGTRKVEQEQIYISIPKGVDSKEFIILERKGNKYDEKNIGDIKCIINILKDERFLREGLNIIYTINLSFKESLIGFEKTIDYFNGKKLKYKQPRGKIITQDFKKIINGFGMKRDDYKGNLILNFNIEYPEKINEKLIDYLEKNL
tara:strand:- start:463 stop:1329 length:867 start_codon:yes stop_codon:yes gene_type:complete